MWHNCQLDAGTHPPRRRSFAVDMQSKFSKIRAKIIEIGYSRYLSKRSKRNIRGRSVATNSNRLGMLLRLSTSTTPKIWKWRKHLKYRQIVIILTIVLHKPASIAPPSARREKEKLKMFEKFNCNTQLKLMEFYTPYLRPTLLKVPRPDSAWAVELKFGDQDYFQLVNRNGVWSGRWKDFEMEIPLVPRASSIECLIFSLSRYLDWWLDDFGSSQDFSRSLRQLMDSPLGHESDLPKIAKLLYELANNKIQVSPIEKTAARIAIYILMSGRKIDIGFNPDTQDLQYSLLKFKSALKVAAVLDA
jgi:hypothetical protein